MNSNMSHPKKEKAGGHWGILKKVDMT